MEWLQKVIAQVNRVFPNAQMTEDATEAEVVDFLESQESISEALENSEKLNGIISRLEKLESASPQEVDTSAFVTSQVLDDKFTSFEESMNGSLDTIKTELAQEINTLKTASSGAQAQSDPNPVPALKKATGKDGKDSMKIEMDELFKNEVVPGLGIL